jgi:hypothetical protein
MGSSWGAGGSISFSRAVPFLQTQDYKSEDGPGGVPPGHPVPLMGITW